jgi:hypothetical protein
VKKNWKSSPQWCPATRTGIRDLPPVHTSIATPPQWCPATGTGISSTSLRRSSCRSRLNGVRPLGPETAAVRTYDHVKYGRPQWCPATRTGNRARRLKPHELREYTPPRVATIRWPARPVVVEFSAQGDTRYLGTSAARESACHTSARGLHTICGPPSGMRRLRPITRIAADENVGPRSMRSQRYPLSRRTIT